MVCICGVRAPGSGTICAVCRDEIPVSSVLPVLQVVVAGDVAVIVMVEQVVVIAVVVEAVVGSGGRT